MIVPPKANVNFKWRLLPFAALFSSAAANLELISETLSNIGPPLRAILRNQFDNSVIFLPIKKTESYKPRFKIKNLLPTAIVCDW